MSASAGGIAIVHYNNTPFDQYSIIRSAKSRRIPFASDTIFKSPRISSIPSELLRLVSRSYWGWGWDCMEAAAAGSSRYDFDKAASFSARNVVD
ncbi:hypothetical protein Syun_025137 [Stephania yunnanensis]|uniref:Uncharacterized protein n=1 Tax=Stephania yunnanensis TaxID=152371 RepID=A0AAP0EU19_9MAGN